MGIFSSLKIAAVILLVIGLGSGYWYVQNLRTNLATSETNNIKLTQAVQTQQHTLKKMQQDFIDIRVKNAELNMLSEKLQKSINKLNDKFNIKANGLSRDFGAISRAKPGLINKIVNRATVNVNRCLELATGAVPQKGEKNNECKDLINP